MQMIYFPFVALPLGLVFFIVVSMGQQVDAEGVRALPLLTLLVLSEFAFFATGIGAYIGFKQTQQVGFQPVYVMVSILCAVSSLFFMFQGINLWPL
ncbi:MAG: hypothetical protein Q9M17_02740 [Mariprofundus sp.]|nr:hypothetical protein [Mariprofundus sp.]